MPRPREDSQVAGPERSPAQSERLSTDTTEPDAAEMDERSDGSGRGRSRPPANVREFMNDPDMIALVARLTWRTDEGKPKRHSTRRVLKRLQQLAAERRYGLTPSRIAKVAPQTILTMLDNAYEQHLMEVWHNDPHERLGVYEIADALRDALGLKDVRLCPGDPRMLDPELPPELQRSIHRDVRMKMAALAAEYLGHRVHLAWLNNPHGQYVVGIAWGYTMSAVVAYVRSRPRADSRPSGLIFIPIIGPTSNDNIEPVEAPVLAALAAESFGARAVQFASPAFVPRERQHVLRSIPQIENMVQHMRRADLVFTGLGPLADAHDPWPPRLSWDLDQSQALTRDAREAGAIAEICGWPFDAEGREITNTHYAVMGIGYGGLQAIAADRYRDVVLVAGGDLRRIDPIRIALQKGKLAKVLISDTVTARELLARVRK